VPVEVRSAIAGGVVALGIVLGDGLLGRDSEPRRKKAFCGQCEVKQLNLVVATSIARYRALATTARGLGDKTAA
jgi:hypothetical protein